MYDLRIEPRILNHNDLYNIRYFSQRLFISGIVPFHFPKSSSASI